jgi:hypothetical protein
MDYTDCNYCQDFGTGCNRKINCERSLIHRAKTSWNLASQRWPANTNTMNIEIDLPQIKKWLTLVTDMQCNININICLFPAGQGPTQSSD